MSQIESTYKSPETEEFLDIYFCRPFGYGLAVAARALRLTPNALTGIGALIGILGGHLLYYTDMRINIAGILLLILCEAIDSADGQLARMTGNYSKAGRIIDGIGDNLKFVSIYIHLTLRIIGNSGQWWIFGIAFLAGISHSTQGAIADYFRSCYLHYVVDPLKGDLESLESIESQYRSLSWSRSFFDKLTARLYLNYNKQQNYFIGTYRKIFFRTTSRYGTSVPAWFKELYRQANAAQIKYYNILTTNTRLVVLFIAILTNCLWLYFAFEVTVLNGFLCYVVWKQKRIGNFLWTNLDNQTEELNK